MIDTSLIILKFIPPFAPKFSCAPQSTPYIWSVPEHVYSENASVGVLRDFAKAPFPLQKQVKYVKP